MFNIENRKLFSLTHLAIEQMQTNINLNLNVLSYSIIDFNSFDRISQNNLAFKIMKIQLTSFTNIFTQ